MVVQNTDRHTYRHIMFLVTGGKAQEYIHSDYINLKVPHIRSMDTADDTASSAD